ncbi:MAG: acyltransferase [Bacteroidetes bacterium]|nr:acyltransferase [Bacteroidota bacterium]
MDKKKLLENNNELKKHLTKTQELNIALEDAFLNHYNRSLPMADHVNDRWERAQRLGFGKGSNIYDSSYVIGDVKVGENCWIGMFTILDGSGGLSIGNQCTISAGVHIYSHDNVKATLSNNKLPIERLPVYIGNNVYVGPHSVISKSVTLGDFVVVAAQSFVNKSFPDFAIIAGTPAKHIGNVIINNNEIQFKYFK